MFKHIFGPVPSRRLGMSLGIDVIPKKVCSLDCVYCEVGETTKLTVDRREYVLYDRLVAELDQYFQTEDRLPDYYTFSGSGEPTLNSRLADLIRYVKERRPSAPVAVLTNGTLLHDPEVRAAVGLADLVLPSLDSAREESFRAINRPEASLSVQAYVDGLVAFRAEYPGKIYLEVFVLPGYNMADEDADSLRAAVLRIGPDLIQINTLDRPGAIPGLRAATELEIDSFIRRLNLSHVEIIAPVQERKKNVSYRHDTESAILETIQRRPCTLEDITKILGMHVNEVNKYLDVLENDGRIEVVSQERGFFYRPARKEA
ncbi:MAG TPA: radical SAM protein [Spirochaetales bacterium]|nr:radical SAM protein [Spirochaetales bacterium]